MRGDVSIFRAVLYVCVGVICILPSAGCVSADLEKFSRATRVDARSTMRWANLESPFSEQFSRVPPEGRLVCEDRAALALLHETLLKYDKQWENWWGVPPDPPPVVLEFYVGTQWLGTVDVYDWAIGNSLNLIRRLEPKQAAEILSIICDCAESAESKVSP